VTSFIQRAHRLAWCLFAGCGFIGTCTTTSQLARGCEGLGSRSWKKSGNAEQYEHGGALVNPSPTRSSLPSAPLRAPNRVLWTRPEACPTSTIVHTAPVATAGADSVALSGRWLASAGLWSPLLAVECAPERTWCRRTLYMRSLLRVAITIVGASQQHITRRMEATFLQDGHVHVASIWHGGREVHTHHQQLEEADLVYTDSGDCKSRSVSCAHAAKPTRKAPSQAAALHQSCSTADENPTMHAVL
jgi:hypothetical protein